MSFYTSLYYYRTDPIDHVDASSFAPVVEAIVDAQIVDHYDARMSLRFADGSIKPGSDRRVIAVTDYVEIVAFDGPDFDTEEQFDTVGEMVAAMRRVDRPIGGASIDLGFLVGTVGDAICKIAPTDNPNGFAPDSIGLVLDSLSLGTLGEGVTKSLHTVALVIHGNGYLYPATPASLIKHAVSIPQIAAIADACRAAWPCGSGWEWGVAEG